MNTVQAQQAQQAHKPFTIFWRDGTREVMHGVDVAAAFVAAGHSLMIHRMVDFHKEGDVQDYTWDANRREWTRTTPLIGA